MLARFRTLVAALVAVTAFVGCGRSPESSPDSQADSVPTAPALDDPVARRWERLLTELKEQNPDFRSEESGYQAEHGLLAKAEFNNAGLRDISPLADVPLRFLSLRGNPVADLAPLRDAPIEELYLEETQVADLSPLKALPLRTLWLNHAPVRDLKPLAGMPITNLNLLGTNVADLTPLKGLPLESLWLNETPVTDLSPLADCPLVSLTVHKAPVRDLLVLRKIPSLARLHIGESAVTDLRPLEGLRLTRLIFTPSRIEHGLDVVRNMATLRELDAEFREPQPLAPGEFWRRYDAGEFR